MENPQIRLLNARLLIQQECAGELIRFAERINKSQPQTSAIVGENPTKNIGLKIAREIVAAFGKTPGWLDLPHFQDWQKADLWSPGEGDEGYDSSLREPRTLYINVGANSQSIEVRSVPIVAWVMAGDLSQEQAPPPPEVAEDWLFIAADTTLYSLVMSVTGTSPLPGVQRGPGRP